MTTEVNGVKMPDDDHAPWVIIVSDMTTAQAHGVGRLLAEHGVHGVFQSGVLAAQLAQQWIPDPNAEPDLKRKYRRHKNG